MKWNASFEFVEADGSELNFVVRGPTLDALFREASEALLVATVEGSDSIGDEVTYPLKLVDPQLGLLLPRFLNQLIHLRETRGLLLHAHSVQLQLDAEARLQADLVGETIELGRHPTARVVKAALTQTPGLIGGAEGWQASVRLTMGSPSEKATSKGVAHEFSHAHVSKLLTGSDALQNDRRNRTQRKSRKAQE